MRKLLLLTMAVTISPGPVIAGESQTMQLPRGCSVRATYLRDYGFGYEWRVESSCSGYLKIQHNNQVPKGGQKGSPPGRIKIFTHDIKQGSTTVDGPGPGGQFFVSVLDKKSNVVQTYDQGGQHLDKNKTLLGKTLTARYTECNKSSCYESAAQVNILSDGSYDWLGYGRFPRDGKARRVKIPEDSCCRMGKHWYTNGSGTARTDSSGFTLRTSYNHNYEDLKYGNRASGPVVTELTVRLKGVHSCSIQSKYSSTSNWTGQDAPDDNVYVAKSRDTISCEIK